jgi:hypothetical protein
LEQNVKNKTEGFINKNELPRGFKEIKNFSLVEALLGHRSHRLFLGAEIPDGVLAYKSNYPVMPLSELEKFLRVGAETPNLSGGKV